MLPRLAPALTATLLAVGVGALSWTSHTERETDLGSEFRTAVNREFHGHESETCDLRVREVFHQGIRTVGEVDGTGEFAMEGNRGWLKLAAGDQPWSNTRRDGDTLTAIDAATAQTHTWQLDETDTSNLLVRSPGIDAVLFRDVYRLLGAPELLGEPRQKTVSSTSATSTVYAVEVSVRALIQVSSGANRLAWSQYLDLGLEELELEVQFRPQESAVVAFELPVATESQLESSAVRIESSCRWR